jgi:hypothetical protein
MYTILPDYINEGTVLNVMNLLYLSLEVAQCTFTYLRISS